MPSYTVGNAVATHTESALKIHLVQGVSRGERMDIIVQKATELGVKRITPVLTEYGVVKLKDDRAEQTSRALGKNCDQRHASNRVASGHPLIDAPLPLKSWFGSQDRGGRCRSHPAVRARLCRNDIADHAPSTKACLLIGPEGGFSELEYEDAAVAGFTAVSLGPRVLRTETAAIAAIAVAQSSWGDLGLD